MNTDHSDDSAYQLYLFVGLLCNNSQLQADMPGDVLGSVFFATYQGWPSSFGIHFHFQLQFLLQSLHLHMLEVFWSGSALIQL